MKKFLTIITSLVCIFLFSINSCIAFDTNSNGNISADKAEEGHWAYTPVTGTRYVIRINGNDIGSNGKGSHVYYINHVKVGPLDYYNPYESKEKKKFNKKPNLDDARAYELVYIGSAYNNVDYFTGDNSKYHFFDTPASSVPYYPTTYNNITQYRHIINWKRPQKDTKGKLYLDKFELNESDVTKLVEAIEWRASALNDTNTLAEINQIKTGGINYEIRAEILMSMRVPKTRRYKDTKLHTISGKDMYVEFKFGQRAYMTYREAKAIENKYDFGYDSPIYNHFATVADQLWEVDEPWYSEYISSAISTNKKTRKENGVEVTYKKAICDGWDYVSFKNPYEPTTVVESCQLEDGTPITVTNYPKTTTWVEDTEKEFKRPELAGYDYVGMKVNSGTQTTSKSTKVSGTTKTSHTIVYIYKESITTTTVVESCQLEDGTTLTVSGYPKTTNWEDDSSKIFTKPTVSGYTYVGMIVNEGTLSSKTSTTISGTTKTSHTIVYVYKEIESTTVLEYCQLADGTLINKSNYPPKRTKWEDDSSKTFTRPNIDGYIYLGVIVDNAGRTNANTTTATISGTTKTSHTIIYVYREMLSTKVTVTYMSTTGKKIGGPLKYTLYEGDSDSYSQTGVQAYSINYNYVSTTINGIDKGNYPNVPITCDGNDYDIIFYYDQEVQVKVIGVFDGKAMNNVGYLKTENIPLSKEYTLDLDGYDCEGHLIKYETHTWLGEAAESTLKKAKVVVNEKEDVSEVPTSKVLVVFYYNAKYTLSVKHENITTGKSWGEYTKALIPDQTLNISSDADWENLNHSVELNGKDKSSSISGFKANSMDNYTVPVEYAKKNQTLIFKYIGCNAIVNHYLVDPATKNPSSTPFKTTNATITTDGKVQASSVGNEYNYMNWGVKVDNASKTLPESSGGQYGRGNYTISFDITKASYVIDFYYINCNVTVNHYLLDPETKAIPSTPFKTTNATITTNGKVQAGSIGEEYNYLNWMITVNGTEKTLPGGQYGKDNYTVEFAIADSEYIINFYYIQQQVIVYHQWQDGTNIKKPETLTVPTTQSPDGNYECIKHKLNGNEGGPVSVTVEPIPSRGSDKHILIFIYDEPGPIVNPITGTRVDPNDINNQSFDAANASNKDYWVLDNANHKVDVVIVVDNVEGCTVDTSAYTAHVTFPFDVYVNGTLKSVDTAIPVTIGSNGKGVLENIFVPIWTDEKEHTITATIGMSYNRDEYNMSTGTTGSVTKTKTAEAEAKVTVVGRVYDFSVINLKADEKWQAALFRDKEAHLSDTLPLGQNNIYQPEKYTTGILKGAPIYFSLNTKGSDNERVIIKPSFYYAEKGSTGSSPETVRNITLKDSKGNTLDTKDIVLSNDDIKTFLTGRTEFDNDRKAAKTYGLTDNLNQNINLGNSSSLTLNTNVKLPYAGYVSEFNKTLPTGKETKNLLEEASQWYGCYTIPNDAVAYDENGKKLENGFIIVYFEIITQRKNTSGQWVDYLSYSLPSPILTTGDSEWQRERDESTNVYLLPRKSKTSNDKKNVADWLIDEFAATIIYEINASTKDNYTSVGTH